MTIKVYHNGNLINVFNIKINQRVNTIGSADISVIDVNEEYEFNFFDEIEIYNDDGIIFRGIIVQSNKNVDEILTYNLFVCDPLYKMKLQRMAGGVIGKTNDLLDKICEDIGIVNNVNVKDYLSVEDLTFGGDVLVFPDGYDGNYDYTDVVAKFADYDNLPDVEKTIQYGDSIKDIWIRLQDVRISLPYYGIVFNNHKFPCVIQKLEGIATNTDYISFDILLGIWWSNRSYADENHISHVIAPDLFDADEDTFSFTIGGTVYDETQPVEIYLRMIGELESQTSLWYDDEITYFQFLQDLSQLHLFNFYYDVKTNSLRSFEENYGDENTIENITKYSETYRDTIQNRLRIKNFK